LQLDLAYLRRHYAGLSDESLLEIDRGELVEAAQKCYDEELARRKPARPAAPAASLEPQDDQVDDDAEPDTDAGSGPAWLEDGACACAFVESPGSDAAGDAANARGALEDARIPCYVAVEKLPPESAVPGREREYRVLVPGALNLHAVSVLDRDVFNQHVEADWRAHFEVLSDDALLALDSEIICAGLVDRVERLKRAYSDELARRGLTPS
jgi:hypothetical protein